MKNGYNLTKRQRGLTVALFAVLLLALWVKVGTVLHGLVVMARPLPEDPLWEAVSQARLFSFKLALGAALLGTLPFASLLVFFVLDRTKVGPRFMHYRSDDPQALKLVKVASGAAIFCCILLGAFILAAAALK